MEFHNLDPTKDQFKIKFIGIGFCRSGQQYQLYTYQIIDHSNLFFIAFYHFRADTMYGSFDSYLKHIMSSPTDVCSILAFHHRGIILNCEKEEMKMLFYNHFPNYDFHWKNA